MSSSPNPSGGPTLPFSLPDRYRVKRHLANGGMASVWCAEDRQLDRSVAIKVLAHRFVHDAEAVHRFRREARAAARVGTHPHVATVYDVDVTPPDGDGPGRAFIVMEYLAGGTVADAIRHDDVRRQEAIRWLREAGSALDHAHAAGIVHRDIKPANFLLDRSRILYVADFGIARLTSEETITSPDQLFGTAAYLSPEQALGNEATSASDRYALAVVAFELLVGRRPFHSPHFSAQARQHIEDPPPAASDLNRTIPPAADAVLAAALAKDPQHRPPTADAFMRELESALGERRPVHRQAPPRRATGPAMGAPDALTEAARGGRGRAPASRSVAAGASRRPREAPTWSPSSPPPSPPGKRRRRRLGAFAALLGVIAILAVVTAAATGAFSGSSTKPSSASASLGRSDRATHALAARSGAGATPQAAANTSPTPAELEATGHRQMLAGNYTQALLTLRQAVSSANHASSTYAYALYDLGRTMLLSGDPQGAVRVLQQRLAIPLQSDAVQQTLDQAMQAAGLAQPAQTAPSTSTATTSTTTSTTTTESPKTTTPTTPTRPTGGAGVKAPPATGGGQGNGAPSPGDGQGANPGKGTGPGPGQGTGGNAGSGNPGKGNPGNGKGNPGNGTGNPGNGKGNSGNGGGDGPTGDGPGRGNGGSAGNGSGGAPANGGAGLGGQFGVLAVPQRP